MGLSSLFAMRRPQPQNESLPPGLFAKTSLRFTGTPAASAALGWFLRLSAAGSAITRHRGFGCFLGALSRLPRFRAAHCTATLAEGSLFRFGATDPYWGYYIYTGQLYEPSLHRVFAAIAGMHYQVLDCGANYGYWSVLLSGPCYGNKNVVAVEASATTFDLLESNCALNGSRFSTVHRAVSSRSGQSLLLERPGHDRAHVRPAGDGAPVRSDQSSSGSSDCEPVESISLDDLCALLKPAPAPLVIKLDVEGHEIEALESASCIRLRDTLIIFEDHGLDPSCRNSAYLLGRAEFAILWIDDLGAAFELKDLSEVQRIKKPRNYGYNFVAVTRNGAFHRRLLRV
jgi:FkbM family methyltransferase